MRQYKFRAWDKIDKRMRYENDVDGPREWPSILAVGFHGLPICIDKDSVKEHEIIGWNRDHNLELMQYTGLTNRNGKEIYEGDIFSNHLGKYVVRFERGAFYLHYPPHIGLDSDEHCDLYLSTALDEYLGEIIGNIYEHPELLEG